MLHSCDLPLDPVVVGHDLGVGLPDALSLYHRGHVVLKQVTLCTWSKGNFIGYHRITKLLYLYIYKNGRGVPGPIPVNSERTTS